MLMAYRTSPRAQRLRAHAQEMARGRALYKQGRYAEAYEHFARAAELYPTDRETRRRAQDAARVAGIGTQGIGSLTSPPSVGAADAGGPKVTIETPILPSAWVGPRPDANASAGPSRASRPAQMPPPLDVPAPSGPDSPSTDLPLVPPPGSVVPDTVESITGHSRVDVHDPVGTPPDIGRPADQPVEPDEVVPAPKPKSTGGPIRIEFHPPKRVTGSAPQAGTGPRGDDLRREAQRLWDAGRPAEAATRFGEAATTYRQEAAWAGPDQAAKRQAAQSCDLARQACESQLQ
jgi:tetratricopeptide (TPR) repeat protein